MSKIAKVSISSFILFAIFSFLVSCKQPQKQTDKQTVTGGKPTTSTSSAPQAVTLTTSDGFTLAGTFVQASSSGKTPACLLVHQLGKDKSTYKSLQERLAAVGISSLAIDLRGHGESRTSTAGTVDYRSFTDERQWIAMTADLEAGLAYLRNHDAVDKTRIGIVGASIGANLAVVVAADDRSKGEEPSITCLVLLSPGANYHGVKPHPRARELGRMPVLIVCGTRDSCYKDAQSLSNAARGGELVSFSGGAHGTDLFEADPTILDDTVRWIQANISASPAQPPSPQPQESGVQGEGVSGESEGK